MRKSLKCSIIVLVSLIAFERIINAEEDEEDAALARINNLFNRSPRMASSNNQSPSLKDSNTKRELESKLSDLLEFGAGPTKSPVLRREDVDEPQTARVSTSETSPFKRFDPVDKDDEEEPEGRDESVEYYSEDLDTQETTKSPSKHSQSKQSKHAELADKIRKKLTDKETKFTVSLPVAIVIVGSIILVTCCCSLYLRNRLVACINTVTGKKKKKSKMLAVDPERGRMTPRSRRKSVISTSKKRARSLSQDVVNIATQKSSAVATTKEEPEEESTTGCYRCCQKKKKRGKKFKR